MKQAEQPLYPKSSSIYNKIMQLASAILIIIVLMSMWQATDVKNRNDLAEHFSYIAKQQLKQAAIGAETLLEQEYGSKALANKALQIFINRLSETDYIKQVHVYDKSGLLIVASQLPQADKVNAKDTEHQSYSDQAKSINELYGLAVNQKNISDYAIPFVQEIRGTELFGYIRFTIEKYYLTHDLAKADEDQQALLRLMLLLAGVVGFLLTRGLNRFSRRGYRLNKASKLEVQQHNTSLASQSSNQAE